MLKLTLESCSWNRFKKNWSILIVITGTSSIGTINNSCTIVLVHVVQYKKERCVCRRPITNFGKANNKGEANISIPAVVIGWNKLAVICILHTRSTLLQHYCCNRHFDVWIFRIQQVYQQTDIWDQIESDRYDSPNLDDVTINNLF